MALLASAFAAPAFAADKWQGADDLPTNPLPCDGGAGTVVSKPYDGGAADQRAGPPGKPITLVDVPKLIGIGYFAATTKGEGEAATELGNVR